MLQLSCLLLLVPLSYGQQNNTHVENSTLPSVLIELIPSAKQEDVDSKSIKTVTPTIPNSGSELVAKQSNTSDAASVQERCSDNFVEDGFCVPYYTCNNTKLQTESDIIDLAIGYTTCTSYIDVCCSPEDVMMDSPTLTPDVISVQTKVSISCGHRNPKGFMEFRSTTDQEKFSAFGEFPWTVAVLRTESVAEKESPGQKLIIYVGAGSLIHPSVVLTGAHVVAKHQELRIRAGEWDTQTTREIYPHQDRDVEEVVLHPDFKPKSLHNDIALLFLSSPVDVSLPHVGVACLPNDDVVDNTLKACFAGGWGKDQFGKEGRYTVILKKVELPLVGQETCEDKLRQTRLGARFRLNASFLCAGGDPGKDTCVGDGGAPLVCPVKDGGDKYVQTGIVAWGIGCGTDGVPAVYVNVAKFRSWIDDNVASRGYDSKIYTI